MCNGIQPDQSFRENWINGTCGDLYFDTLSWLDSGELEYNLARQQQIRDGASESFERLLDMQDGEVRNFHEPEFSDLQEAMYNAFKRTPQSAVDALTDYCSGMTREEIASSQAKLRFCGCYAPDIPVNTDTQIDKPCDPLCNRGDTIKIPIEGSMNSQKCENNVCVIDNITIQAAGGSGNVTLEQVCNGCTETTPCACIISNVIVTDELRGDVPVQVSQSCSPQTTRCFLDNIEVPCSDLIGTTVETTGLSTTAYLVIIGVVITIIVLIVAIIITATSSKGNGGGSDGGDGGDGGNGIDGTSQQYYSAF